MITQFAQLLIELKAFTYVNIVTATVCCYYCDKRASERNKKKKLMRNHKCVYDVYKVKWLLPHQRYVIIFWDLIDYVYHVKWKTLFVCACKNNNRIFSMNERERVGCHGAKVKVKTHTHFSSICNVQKKKNEKFIEAWMKLTSTRIFIIFKKKEKVRKILVHEREKKSLATVASVKSSVKIHTSL